MKSIILKQNKNPSSNFRTGIFFFIALLCLFCSLNDILVSTPFFEFIILIASFIFLFIAIAKIGVNKELEIYQDGFSKMNWYCFNWCLFRSARGILPVSNIVIDASEELQNKILKENNNIPVQKGFYFISIEEPGKIVEVLYYTLDKTEVYEKASSLARLLERDLINNT